MSEIIRKKHVADIVISICHETEEVDRTSVGKVSSVSRSVTANGKLIYQDTMSAAESRVSQDPIKKLIDFLGGRLKSDIYPDDRSRLYFFQQFWRRAFSEKLKKEDMVSYPGRLLFTSTERPYEKLWLESGCGMAYHPKEYQVGDTMVGSREELHRDALLRIIKAGIKYIESDRIKLRQQCYDRVPKDMPYSSRLSFAQDLYDWITNSTPESPKEEKEVSNGK